MTWARICAWLVALEYFLKQNAYFGWNAKPGSDTEVLADGITLLLVAVAICLTAYEPTKVEIHIIKHGEKP